MAKDFVLTEEMKSKVGWESAPWTYEVTTSGVRAFARGVGYTDPIYYEIDAAQKAGYPNLPVPPTYIGTPVFIPGKSEDTYSVPPDEMPDVKHGLRGFLDGGTETEYLEEICAGDTLTAVVRLAGLDLKESGNLGTMLIMSIEKVLKNQQGKTAAIQRAKAIFY